MSLKKRYFLNENSSTTLKFSQFTEKVVLRPREGLEIKDYFFYEKVVTKKPIVRTNILKSFI